MFKQLVTLIRASLHNGEEKSTDRNALQILRQQIRGSVRTVSTTKILSPVVFKAEHPVEQSSSIGHVIMTFSHSMLRVVC